MSSQIILLIVAIVTIVMIAYLIGILLRKKNDSKIAELELHQEKIFALPIANTVADIQRLHLVGQSQQAFEQLEKRWLDISQKGFTDIEENLSDLHNYNDTLNFIKVKQAMANLEAKLDRTEEELKTLHEEFQTLQEQEKNNSDKVKHALDMYEEVQNSLYAEEASFGPAIHEINSLLQNIQEEFSEFVTLNSAGDPIEAAAVLDQAETHTIALYQIKEIIPEHVLTLQEDLPEQLLDLENGYARLLDNNYQFGDLKVEASFQKIRDDIAAAMQDLANLDLEKLKTSEEDIQTQINNLYDAFEKEITAYQAVNINLKRIPAFFEHVQSNQKKLVEEMERLQKNYILEDSDLASISSLNKELEHIEKTILPSIVEQEIPEKPYSVLDVDYRKTVDSLNDIEQGQIQVLERLKSIAKNEHDARVLLDHNIQRIHSIKRYMEKRYLPGIPQEFLMLFFSTSSQLEALKTELGRNRIDMKVLNQLREGTNLSMNRLESSAYEVVEYATLTEQLLQYSNRYRTYDPDVQASFEEAYDYFEVQHNYVSSFNVIAYSLELVEPGVTERFVKSYEKTRETIGF